MEFGSKATLPLPRPRKIADPGEHALWDRLLLMIKEFRPYKSSNNPTLVHLSIRLAPCSLLLLVQI